MGCGVGVAVNTTEAVRLLDTEKLDVVVIEREIVGESLPVWDRVLVWLKEKLTDCETVALSLALKLEVKEPEEDEL